MRCSRDIGDTGTYSWNNFFRIYVKDLCAVTNFIEERAKMRRLILAIMALLILSSSSVYASGGGNVWYSVVFPGWGQIKSARYGRGALLVSAEAISLAALLVTNIQYDRAVEQYDRAKTSYLSATYIGDANEYYERMSEKWDEAERLHKYRKILVGTAVGIWAIGIVDMLWGGDADRPSLSIEVGGDEFRVVKSITF